MLGLDGLAEGVHANEVTALEDSRVCAWHGGLFGSALREQLSLEIVRGHLQVLLLGQLCARARVGAFLLDLSQRAQARGQSASCLVLAMPRSDVGSYLGVTLETVSRMLTQLKDEGLIDVHNRHVMLHDLPAFTRQFRLRAC